MEASLNRLRNLNPCYDESLLSLKCQENNSAEKCKPEIDNYKTCQDFWNKIIDYRKWHSIKPRIPQVEEQVNIKKVYRESKSLQSVYKFMLDNRSKNSPQ